MTVRLVLAALAALATPALAHEVRPGYLELRERAPGRFDVLWKAPARGEERLAISPRLPGGCADGEHRARIDAGAWIERWQTTCADGLAGGRIAIDGLAATRTDVLVRIEWLAGGSTTRLTPESLAFAVAGPATRGQVLGTYVVLGVEHILLGIDHLLFVLALLFLVSDARRLVATITAFTAAHSLTLSAAALGWVHVPQAPVEAVIALSIVFVAAEVARGAPGVSGAHNPAPDLAHRHPWLVAFAFGLLHGLGFAGALREVGLPEHAVPLALLGFNVGVELGQLAFVGALFVLLGLAVGTGAAPGPRAVTATLARPMAYAIGPVASFWLIQRTWSFFPT